MLLSHLLEERHSLLNSRLSQVHIPLIEGEQPREIEIVTDTLFVAQLLIEGEALLKPCMCLCKVISRQPVQPCQVVERVGNTHCVSQFPTHLQTVFEQAAGSRVLTLIDGQAPQVD